ncbi:MAG: hypothetical protein FJX72_02130 [Armatimonadetes bacterium]|nr:hypothetical protein [Armatimonadota bacterium]
MSADTKQPRRIGPHSAALAVGLVMFGAMAARFLAPSAPAHAQGGPQGGPPGFGQGPGGPGGRPPFVMGQVLEVGLTQKMIAVSSPFGGDEQMIKVTDKTKIVTQTDAKVSTLKVGDQVQVNGMPTGIRASSLTIGEAPDMFRMMMPGQRGGNRQGGRAGSATPPAGFAMATGKVTVVSPLTIALDATVSAVIKLAPDARVQKIAPVALSAIKENDRVMAGGEMDNEGVLTATTITVNMGGGGMGGMFGGPGGPGGPGGGPGGGPRPGGAPPQ